MAKIQKRRAGVRWRGLQVASKMQGAEIRGINVIMSRTVRGAKNNHEWINRTGSLEGSIGIDVFAHPQGSGASGLWGSSDIVYARVQELGSEKMNIPATRFLRNQADEHYPDLASEIRKAF